MTVIMHYINPVFAIIIIKHLSRKIPSLKQLLNKATALIKRQLLFKAVVNVYILEKLWHKSKKYNET